MGLRREEDATRKLGQRVGLSPNDPSLAIEALSGATSKRS